MSSGLTEEQKRRIEENKRRALARRAEKQSPVKSSIPPTSKTINNTTIGISGQKNVFNTTKPNYGQNSGFNSMSAGRPFSGVHSGSEWSTQGAQIKQTSNVTTSSTGQGPRGSNDYSNKSNSSSHVTTSSAVQDAQRQSNFYNKSSSSSSDVKSASSSSAWHNAENIKNSISLQNKTSDVKSSSFSGSWNNANSNSVKSSTNSWNTKGASQGQSKPAFLGKGVKGQCTLISRERFEVNVGYSAPLIELFKSMDTKLYDAVSKKWSFKLIEYDRFIKAVQVLKPNVQIDPLPKAIFQVFSAQMKGENPRREAPIADLSKVDKTLVSSLMPFQREGVNFGIWKNGRVLVADDMGLGKTIQAICLSCYYRQDWPLLIVVPSSIRYDWAQQFRNWVPSLDPQEINVAVTGQDKGTAGLINILSYDLMAKQAKALREKCFQIVIMDECHLLKNYKTARCKAALPLLQNARHVILLSGTPALSRPAELYTQISAICPFLFKFHDFGVRYCDGKQHPWGWDYSGSSNMTELQLILEEKIMIRRLKVDVLSQLPAKVRQMVLLDPSSITINKDLKRASKVANVSKLKGGERRGALLDYFHETARAKIAAVRDYVVDMLEGDRKFLIFAHHTEVMDGIEDIVRSKIDRNYIRIDGSTTAEQRNFFCKKFQTNSDIRVAVLSIMACNAGLNLSAANLVIFAELFWNPGIMVQAEDRAHRIGQQDSVSVHYLVAQRTADDDIWPMVQKKLQVLSKAGLTTESFSELDTTRVKEDDMPQSCSEIETGDEQELETVRKPSPKKQTKLFSYFSPEKGTSSTTTEQRTPVKSNNLKKKKASILNYLSPVKQSEQCSVGNEVNAGEGGGAVYDDGLDVLLDEVDWDDDIGEPQIKKPRT